MTLRESIAGACLAGPKSPSEVMASGTGTWEFRFGADDPVFVGHFPGRPLLPGIHQLEMARAGVEWAVGSALGIRGVLKSKFQRPIRPGEIVRVELKWSESDGTIRVRAGFSVGGERAGETGMTLWRCE